ncbi:putative TetR family transcriptional regulator [Gordonia hirsuta DSM 44140 = NBRC 16056]|uniref:Putative TetR family transcriptional regulator n=1 Tax=Gordonia hirsuta DSM 44140 = NBRC 16056 TaxID=1121927 RepID=L7LB31_9ACTN|nr:TetR/AcrR family transcriptional regulator [Gordonia hirsuta]GAC58340.1 putative TetR family transcriptional regulator [Gordonia hirsuta DSM 44140 = NBRC 16056]
MENVTEIASKAQQTRTRLLNAAVEAFAERGFHGTTTRDLATAAGMSPAAVYVHYPSKEHLLYELSLAGHQKTLAEINANDDPALGSAARLHRLIYAFALHHALDHTTARIVNYELASLSPEHFAQIRELRREITRRVRTVIEDGVAAGDFHTADVQTVNLAILSMNIDIARWYSAPGSPAPEALARSYADLALLMVQADPV